ncbi:MAG: hypothetical protein IKY59_05165, partial [Oscillospiraceae bacterium]|nr:hypothetical protein [Oscillospiraceae bacterium]
LNKRLIQRYKFLTEFAICPNRRDIPLRRAICAAAHGNLYHIASEDYIAFAKQIYRVAKQHIAKRRKYG